MKRFPCLISMLLWCSAGWAATPTLVQSVWGPNSLSGEGGANWPGNPSFYYSIEYPEPTQSGNLLVCSAFGYAHFSATYSINDDMNQAWTLVGSNFPFQSASDNVYSIWYVANNAGGTRQVRVTASDDVGGFVAVHCMEFYNVASTSPVDGAPNCNSVTATTLTGTSTGTLTSGDLILLESFNDNVATTASFTAGSQPNINWVLDAADYLDGYAGQYGVYSTTASFTPQMTTGTSSTYISCQVAFKSASAGTAPTQSMRIVHLGHYSMPPSGTIQTLGFPSSGNLLVASFTGGGDSISGITSTPSNTWNSTGTAAGSATLGATSQIYYAANASSSTTETVAITRTGTLEPDTVLIYDITGANSSPFDTDSEGQSGTQNSEVSSFTTCTTCLTPSTASDIVILNANQVYCTGTAITAPSGALFDSAFATLNSINGPEPVDQNGEWAHYYSSNTSGITATWTMSCNQAESAWAGRVASFKSAQNQPLPPTGLKGAVVTQ
jgi:hypothetical protein